MSKKILLIEDDYYLSRLYQRTLMRAGFSVTLAEDGLRGWEEAQNNAPDLILLDIMMPKMNGMDVLKNLKAQETTAVIPVIMLTNLEQDDLIEKALAMGANGFWIKVVMPPPDLIAYVQEFFEKPLQPKTIIHPRYFYRQQKPADDTETK